MNGSNGAAMTTTFTKKQENKSLFTTGDTNSGGAYMGISHAGYELWADKDCVYVKRITEVDLARRRVI